jgi:hypothetical protein
MTKHVEQLMFGPNEGKFIVVDYMKSFDANAESYDTEEEATIAMFHKELPKPMTKKFYSKTSSDSISRMRIEKLEELSKEQVKHFSRAYL